MIQHVPVIRMDKKQSFVLIDSILIIHSFMCLSYIIVHCLKCLFSFMNNLLVLNLISDLILHASSISLSFDIHLHLACSCSFLLRSLIVSSISISLFHVSHDVMMYWCVC